jgi:signal transduction histidine kinase/CheY-like chemotaxis protein
MTYELPAVVKEYLNEVWFEQRAMFCAMLSDAGAILQSLGPAHVFGIGPDATEITDMIAGLSADDQVIIPFVQFANGRPAHLHHVTRFGQRFVLLFAADNTFAEMGAQQQLANELALANIRQAQTIAALTQAQQLLRDSERELKRTHDLKSLFISKMSHEFGTPITAVLGRMRLLEGVLSANAAPVGALEHLTVVRRGVLHLHQLVQSVLDEARLEQGTLRLEPTRVKISTIIDDLVQLFSAVAQEKSLKFEAAFDGDQLLWIDALRVKQILINLVSNGLKYTHEGKVSLYMHWREGRLTASVTDTGPGMTREQSTTLFQPFKRLNERTSVAGTGLGLAISRELAQHMGGNIEVRSTLGDGSSFIFTMPCETAAAIEIGATPSAKVLIVDDDTDIRELLCAVLEQDGFSVSEASNGLEAEQRYRSLSPSVILLDMQLGTEHGTTVARRLRKLGCVSRIVALSASNSDETARHALTSGCDAFLSKPVDFARLKELMQER